MKKLIALLLTLSMVLSMTALAAEAEPVCEDGCDHAHEEGVSVASVNYECNYHNLAVDIGTEYGNDNGATHYYRYVTVEYCTNSGCSYRWITNGVWNTEGHTMVRGMCMYCGHIG